MKIEILHRPNKNEQDSYVADQTEKTTEQKIGRTDMAKKNETPRVYGYTFFSFNLFIYFSDTF